MFVTAGHRSVIVAQMLASQQIVLRWIGHYTDGATWNLSITNKLSTSSRLCANRAQYFGRVNWPALLRLLLHLTELLLPFSASMNEIEDSRGVLVASIVHLGAMIVQRAVNSLANVFKVSARITIHFSILLMFWRLCQTQTIVWWAEIRQVLLLEAGTGTWNNWELLNHIKLDLLFQTLRVEPHQGWRDLLFSCSFLQFTVVYWLRPDNLWLVEIRLKCRRFLSNYPKGIVFWCHLF